MDRGSKHPTSLLERGDFEFVLLLLDQRLDMRRQRGQLGLHLRELVLPLLHANRLELCVWI